jgi:hypothetical protein
MDDVYSMTEDEVYQHLSVYRSLEGWRGDADDEAWTKLTELLYGEHLDREYDYEMR